MMMRRTLPVEIQTPLNSEKGTRQLGNGEKDDILVCDSKIIVRIIRNSKAWLDACIQPALGGSAWDFHWCQKKRQSWKILDKTKQNKNTTHSLVFWRIQKVLFLYPEVKLCFSKTKLWQIQTALKKSFQGFDAKPKSTQHNFQTSYLVRRRAWRNN